MRAVISLVLLLPVVAHADTSGSISDACTTDTMPVFRWKSEQVIGDGISLKAVRHVIKRATPRMRYCYERELMVDPTLTGDVTVSLEVDEHGKSARVAADGISTEVAACIAGVVESLAWPAPEDGEQMGVRFVLGPVEDLSSLFADGDACAAMPRGPRNAAARIVRAIEHDDARAFAKTLAGKVTVRGKRLTARSIKKAIVAGGGTRAWLGATEDGFWSVQKRTRSRYQLSRVLGRDARGTSSLVITLQRAKSGYRITEIAEISEMHDRAGGHAE